MALDFTCTKPTGAINVANAQKQHRTQSIYRFYCEHPQAALVLLWGFMESRMTKKGAMMLAMSLLAAVSLPSGCGTYTMPLPNSNNASQ